MPEPVDQVFFWCPRTLLRSSALVAGLGAMVLGATGRFSAALALTLGAAVAIVSAFWLASLVERLEAPRPGATARFGWKFWLRGALRYTAGGAVLFWAVRMVPAQTPWLLTGLSTVVAAIVVEGLGEIWKESRQKRSGASSPG
ncbi:MAG: ATP synthase subunit I [Thermoanaerobaculia bacterium]